MIFASGSEASCIMLDASITSVIVRSGPPVTFMRTPRAPSMVPSSRSGLDIAFCAASTARFSPIATPVPMTALPVEDITAFTSAKSRLMYPSMIITSEIPWTA